MENNNDNFVNNLRKKTFTRNINDIASAYDKVLEENTALRHRLTEEGKNEYAKDLESQLSSLREHSLLIFLPMEKESVCSFRDKHYKSCNNGSHFIYDIDGTGLGYIIKIKCPVCGEVLDITDMESW